MQLLLIFGIVFAIGAVLFALQNNAQVTVTIALWSFESSLAVVLLLAIGLGALIAGLVSTPTVLRGQWNGARLRRQISSLEAEKAALERRIAALEAVAEQQRPAESSTAEEPRRFAELRSMLTGEEQAPTLPVGKGPERN